MRILLFELLPESPHAKISLACLDVVEKHDASATHFAQPALEDMSYSFAVVTSVNMQQINCLIGEMRQRFIKGALNQPRKAAVQGIVMCLKIVEYIGAMESAGLIAFPGVNRIAPGVDF